MWELPSFYSLFIIFLTVLNKEGKEKEKEKRVVKRLGKKEWKGRNRIERDRRNGNLQKIGTLEFIDFLQSHY